jgi:hypothetical protein
MSSDCGLHLEKILQFANQCYHEECGLYSSTPHGEINLYSTCYAVLLRYCLQDRAPIDEATMNFLLNCQDPTTGYFIGPEIRDWVPKNGEKHDFEHLRLHLTSAVLPVLQEFAIKPKYALSDAQRYCDLDYLKNWLDRRDLRDAWLEGNNLLFVGQLLVYFRDNGGYPDSQPALDLYFRWLDDSVDPSTGLWGTNGYCSPFMAMCGGYHQLLLYCYENRPILFPEQLVDTVISLQHCDGGFSPGGGGGACEDADAVDILVNMYKRINYRRPEIRFVLRRCLNHLINLQNSDGGFPNKKNAPFIHMGIPATKSSSGSSNMFTTWFRIHTIALISEILTDDPRINNGYFRFNSYISMGWHRPWNRGANQINVHQRQEEIIAGVRNHFNNASRFVFQLPKKRMVRFLAKIKLN